MPELNGPKRNLLTGFILTSVVSAWLYYRYRSLLLSFLVSTIMQYFMVKQYLKGAHNFLLIADITVISIIDASVAGLLYGGIGYLREKRITAGLYSAVLGAGISLLGQLVSLYQNANQE